MSAAAAPRLHRPRRAARRATLWLLLIPVQVAVGYGLAEGSASVLAALAAVAAIVVVPMFPRQALLGALAAVPFADVAIKGVPIGEVLVAGVALGLFIRFLAGDDSIRLERPPAWLAFGFALILYLLLASSVFNGALDGEGFRRFGHLAVGGMLAWLLAARVVEPKRAAQALAVGLLVSGLVGLAGAFAGHTLVGGPNYGSRLTGWFGDPNVAGFYLVTLGTAALSLIGSRRAQVGLGAVFLVLLVATESRTSLLAAAAVGAWVIATYDRYKWLPIVAVVVCCFVGFNVPQQLKEAGPFSDRTASDWFRRDIDRKANDRAAASPILGEGAAPARLDVQGGKFFPHNSYVAAIIEGGWFWLLAWLALLGGTLWKLTRAKRRNLMLEGAFVGLFIIALNLGEVLTELPTMIVVGLALGYLAGDTSREPQVSSSGTRSPVGSLSASSLGARAAP